MKGSRFIQKVYNKKKTELYALGYYNSNSATNGEFNLIK
jgi:hypothetical protein